MPLLAALFIGAAGAVQESEQVLLDGDKASFEPVSTELVEINGVPTLTKTFELAPDIDPALLREEPFSQDGYWYRYQRMDKADQETTDTQPVQETITVDAPSGELADVIGQFPATRPYSKDGYTGELLLDVQSIQVEATGYSTVTDSHPHTVTKTYELAYNDRSLVPETVQADGLTLPLTGLSWSETKNVEDSDVPAVWTATATYSKTTYTTREVADGYRATAAYRGEVGKTSIGSVVYTVTYTGSKIPVLPGLDPDVTVSQVAIVTGLAALFLLAAVLWYLRWHIVRIYVYNEERRIHDVVSRQYVRVRTPKLRLSALQGHEETEYTVILRRRLARWLEGLSFNRLEGMGGGYTAQSQLTTTNGHFGAVSIGSRGIFAYVYPGATYENMKKGAGHVDGTSAWNGNVSFCGHNRGSWPYFGNLKYVQVGDVVTYKTSLGIRTYRVTFAGRILATDTDVLNPTAGNQITMLTCIANEPAFRFCVIGQEIR